MYGIWLALGVGLHGKVQVHEKGRDAWKCRGAWNGRIEFWVGLHGKVMLHWTLAYKLDIWLIAFHISNLLSANHQTSELDLLTQLNSSSWALSLRYTSVYTYLFTTYPCIREVVSRNEHITPKKDTT